MTETYSIIVDFSGGISISQLDDEIRNSAIVTSLNGINKYGDTVDIIFSSTITSGEKTILGGLVSVHTPQSNVSFTPFTVYPTKIKYNLPAFKRVVSNKFYGNNYNIVSINFFGCMHTNTTSYDVRVVNMNNGTIIASGNFTNTYEAFNDLGTISNVPTIETEIEFHVKVNGGGYVHIEEITYNLSNR